MLGRFLAYPLQFLHIACARGETLACAFSLVGALWQDLWHGLWLAGALWQDLWKFNAAKVPVRCGQVVADGWAP